MSKHYKPLLGYLRKCGKHGATNKELQMIAHRFGARLEELRKGKYKKTRYNIPKKFIKPGLWRYWLIENELPVDEVLKALNPEPVKPTVTPEEAKAKWEKARQLFRRETQVETTAQMYKRKAQEMEQKLNQALTPEERYNTQTLLNHYQTTYQMYE